MKTLFLVNSFFVIELLSFSYNLNFIVRRDFSDFFFFLVQPFIIHAKMLGQRNRKKSTKLTWWVSGKDRLNSGLLTQHSLHSSQDDFPLGGQDSVAHIYKSTYATFTESQSSPVLFILPGQHQALLLCHKFFKQLPDILCISQWVRGEGGSCQFSSGAGKNINLPIPSLRQCGLKGKTRTQTPWFHQIYKIIKSTAGLILF